MTNMILRQGDLMAEILPEKGGTLTRLVLNGRDFIYEDPANLQSPERPRCGIPFLFPMFGRLRDETYTWEGKSYHMGIHGFGHTSRWQVAAQTEDSALLVLASSPETRTQYPFDFRVEMGFKLMSGTLEIGLTFRNTGTVPLPYNYGFHPYFLAEKLENVEVEANAAAQIDFATGKALPFGHGVVTLNVPEGAPETGAALAQISSPAVIRIPGENRQLTMEFDESFNQMVFWTQAGKKFLCVEPINGSPNGLNTGNYMILAPGEVRGAFLRLHPAFI